MILMMSFGVFPALAAKGGLKLTGICARCNETLVFLNTFVLKDGV